MFLSNPTTEWECISKDNYATHGGQNPLCSIKSECCSTLMANDVPLEYKPLCFWHRHRMATHGQHVCACEKKWDICLGDAIGRYMFRSYYERFDIPVSDMTGSIYCCGSNQNREESIGCCGKMLVCAKCAPLHEKSLKLFSPEVPDDNDFDL